MIQVNHLTKSYTQPNGEVLQVLKDVNCHISKGEVISIIGPSGTGKSTFLRALNLLDEPTSGEIIVGGENILQKKYPLNKLRQRMGMVFQNFNLFEHLTILENVTLAPIKLLGLSKEDAQKEAMQMLRKVGMAEKADAMPKNLSGGQKQRVAIARCLAMHPDIILFDEPTSALDPTLVGEVLSVIRQLAKEGMTMLIVTHEMKFAYDVSTRIFFMNEGVIYEEGTPQQIFENPQREATRAFTNRIRTLSSYVNSADFDIYEFLGQVGSSPRFSSPKSALSLSPSTIVRRTTHSPLLSRLNDWRSHRLPVSQPTNWPSISYAACARASARRQPPTATRSCSNFRNI